MQRSSLQLLQANGYSQGKSRTVEPFKPDKDHSDWFDTMDKRGRASLPRENSRGSEYNREEEAAPRRQQRVFPAPHPFSSCGIIAGICVSQQWRSSAAP